MEWDGELYAKSRLRVGVVGGMADELDEIGAGRVGDTGLRGDGGVTSVCRIELKIALACSERYKSENIVENREHKEATPFSASDSEGIILFFEGVEGPSSFR